MLKAEYQIHDNGKIDIWGGEIKIEGIFPYVNGMPIAVRSMETRENSIRYDAAEGSIVLSFRQEEEGIVLSTMVQGFDGAHDVEPVGNAMLAGARHVYVQGFGMEGPSGYHPIDGEGRHSHGIIALCGDSSAMAVFSADHRRFGTVFSAEEKDFLFSRKKVFSAGVNLESTARGQVSLPDLYFQAGTDAAHCLSLAARQIAKAMNARNCMPPAYYWCSWYYYYENFSQDILEKLLPEFKKEQAKFQYIQIDAGYTPHIGDWLQSNHRYPEGLEKAAETILAAGYKAGIWIAPFLVGDLSELYLTHPDWIVRDKENQPYVVFRSYTEPKIWANRDSNYYVLDTTHPEAFAYLKYVFQTLKGYGFTLYKTDFMLWGMVDSSKAQRYDPSQTSFEIMRNVLAMIREVIGEDSFLLGSIAPFMPFIGYADAMRIAGDNGAQWSDKYGPVNLLQELPYDNYFNNVFWQNDPDSVILRDFESNLTVAETRSLALLQALSGGVVTTSDPVGQLSEERKKWLQFLKPHGKAYAEVPYLVKMQEELMLLHRLEHWNLLFLINPTEHPVKTYCKMDELFGGKDWYLYRYSWDDDGEEAISEKRNDFFDTLMPHDSVLLFVTKEPMAEKPLNLWSR